MPSGLVYLVPSDLTRQLDELRARAENLDPIMAAIAEMFVGRVNEEFDSEGHGQWAKLKPRTLARRRKKGRGAKILQDTGLTAAGIREEHTDVSAEAATDAAAMIYHVSDQPRHIIPLRNPFDVPDDAFDEATEMLLAFVTR